MGVCRRSSPRGAREGALREGRAQRVVGDWNGEKYTKSAQVDYTRNAVKASEGVEFQ
jgi:hypothetical protein